jgi:hypothetical protein
MFARSACVVAVLAAVGLAVVLPRAIQQRHRLQGRWSASHDGVEYKLHFFQGQNQGNGVWKGYFSEQIANGQRKAGKYEVRVLDKHRETITLYDHSLGTVTGNIDLESGSIEVGDLTYHRR